MFCSKTTVCSKGLSFTIVNVPAKYPVRGFQNMNVAFTPPSRSTFIVSLPVIMSAGSATNDKKNKMNGKILLKVFAINFIEDPLIEGNSLVLLRTGIFH
jgi:hypothetical protein